MRVACLSDIHGNLPALEAVLSEIASEPFELVVSAGDVVAGPMSAECLDRLANLGDGIRWVRGNADREVMAAFDGQTGDDSDPAWRAAAFSAAGLEARHRDLLAAFAPTV